MVAPAVNSSPSPVLVMGTAGNVSSVTGPDSTDRRFCVPRIGAGTGPATGASTWVSVLSRTFPNPLRLSLYPLFFRNTCARPMWNRASAESEEF
jgi:hypothetical protein